MSTVAARRRSGGWSPAKRAKTLAAFQARIAAREAADPLHIFKALHAWADPSNVSAIYTTRIVKGRAVGLSEHHELLRRCHVLRAWCARQIVKRSGSVERGWCEATHIDLCEAARHRRLARGARREGR